jgi:uncharacterized damage-inducible protein DinB
MEGSMQKFFRVLACAVFVSGPVLGAAEKKTEPVKTDFTSDLTANLEYVSKQLVSLAEATPADKFAWRPNDQVRRMSEIYMHVVGPNMLMPSMLGAAPPKGLTILEKPFELAAKWEAEVTAKDVVIARLKESFDYAIQAVRTIPASALDGQADAFGFQASKRAYLMILMNHAHEHLGQAVAYARSVGVVPPWTAQQQSAAGGQ